MNSGWKIRYSKEALQFLEKEKVKEKLKENLNVFLRGKNVDIKKMRGKWEGYYRLRLGKARVILTFDFKENIISVVKAGYRGDIY